MNHVLLEPCRCVAGGRRGGHRVGCVAGGGHRCGYELATRLALECRTATAPDTPVQIRHASDDNVVLLNPHLFTITVQTGTLYYISMSS